MNLDIKKLNVPLFSLLLAYALSCHNKNIKDRFEAGLGINNFRNCVTSLTPTYEDRRLERVLKKIKVSRSFLEEVNNINGQRLSLNDLSLLQVLYNNQELYKQFKDRKYLETRLSKIAALTRERYPKYKSADAPLGNVSNINLLKAILLEGSIKKNKEYLMDIIQRDNEDETTEYGGLFEYRNNELTPVEYKADKFITDHTYIPPFDQNFTGGIIPFHIHSNGGIGPSASDLLQSLTYSTEGVVMGIENENLQAIFYSSLDDCKEVKPKYFVLNIGSF